jgi:hypothetical protein
MEEAIKKLKFKSDVIVIYAPEDLIQEFVDFLRNQL